MWRDDGWSSYWRPRSGAGRRFLLSTGLEKKHLFREMFQGKMNSIVIRNLCRSSLSFSIFTLLPPLLSSHLIYHPDLECGSRSSNESCSMMVCPKKKILRITNLSVTYFGMYQFLIYTCLSPRSATRSIIREIWILYSPLFFVRYYFTTFIESVHG